MMRMRRSAELRSPNRGTTFASAEIVAKLRGDFASTHFSELRFNNVLGCPLNAFRPALSSPLDLAKERIATRLVAFNLQVDSLEFDAYNRHGM